MDDDADDHALIFARIEALAGFENAMAGAQQLLELARDDAAKQREAGMAAIHAVLRLMDGCDVSLRLFGPLQLLAGALDSLNGGGAPHLFSTPERRSGKPSLSEHKWAQRAVAAAAYELRCRELGRGGQQRAGEWVIDQTRHWDIWPNYGGGGGATATNARSSLKAWRVAVNKQARGRAGRAVFAYCTDPANGLTAEAVLTREASVWGIPGAPAPKEG